ncbi:MAG: DUF3144 domain-containing protein [Thiolinea sp.]
MADSDPTFYERADAVIHLANNQVTNDIPPGAVSASAMYAVARYNAFISAADFSNVADYKAEREEIIRYFVEEYRKMLEEHIDDHTENFSEYTRPKYN